MKACISNKNPCLFFLWVSAPEEWLSEKHWKLSITLQKVWSLQKHVFPPRAHLQNCHHLHTAANSSSTPRGSSHFWVPAAYMSTDKPPFLQPLHSIVGVWKRCLLNKTKHFVTVHQNLSFLNSHNLEIPHVNGYQNCGPRICIILELLSFPWML